MVEYTHNSGVLCVHNFSWPCISTTFHLHELGLYHPPGHGFVGWFARRFEGIAGWKPEMYRIKICIESCFSYTECWGLSRRIQQYVRAVQSGKAELVLICPSLLLLCVWCRASWEGWGKTLTSKVAAFSDIVRQRRNWSNISFMCKTHMLWSRARSKGISGCILKRFFILFLAEHSACGHQRRYSTARLASDLEDVY